MQNSSPVITQQIQSVAQLLQQTFNDKNDNLRREAEAALNTLSNEPDTFMEILILVIIQQESNRICLVPLISATNFYIHACYSPYR